MLLKLSQEIRDKLVDKPGEVLYGASKSLSDNEVLQAAQSTGNRDGG
jgi:hypothetical protein